MFRWLRKLFQKEVLRAPDKACNRPHYEARPGGFKVVGETSWDYIPRDEKFFEGVAQTIYVEQYCLFGKWLITTIVTRRF